MRHRDPAKLYPHDYVMKSLVLPLVPKWVTPNYVTALRFLLTPFVVWGLAVGQYEWAIPFFMFTAFTDMVDGSLARARKQITEWGTLFDPIADKLLITLAAVVVVTQAVGWWLTTALIFFELAIVLGAVRKKHDGKIVMANNWGKSKMFCQCAGVTFLLFSLALSIPLLTLLGMVVQIFATLQAIMSLITYSL